MLLDPSDISCCNRFQHVHASPCRSRFTRHWQQMMTVIDLSYTTFYIPFTLAVFDRYTFDSCRAVCVSQLPGSCTAWCMLVLCCCRQLLPCFSVDYTLAVSSASQHTQHASWTAWLNSEMLKGSVVSNHDCPTTWSPWGLSLLLLQGLVLFGPTDGSRFCCQSVATISRACESVSHVLPVSCQEWPGHSTFVQDKGGTCCTIIGRRQIVVQQLAHAVPQSVLAHLPDCNPVVQPLRLVQLHSAVLRYAELACVSNSCAWAPVNL